MSEIIRLLWAMPEEQLTEVYRQFRVARGRKPRPGTGPLKAPAQSPRADG